MIHSVDSLRLAQVIEKEAVKKDVDHVDVLLEVNVSGEESKYGMTPAEVEEQIDQFLDLKRVRIRGFMTVAPFAEDPEEVRPYFKRLKQLSVDIQNKTIDNNISAATIDNNKCFNFIL